MKSSGKHTHTYKRDVLLREARERLRACPDVLHDDRHAQRVARYASEIAGHMGIVDVRHLEALEISAWWHDVSRTITRNPSFVVMPFVDDTLSALMLLITIFKRRAFSRSALLALRLVLSKSAATGKVFARIFLTRDVRMLLDILQDADTVDIFAPERTTVIHSLVGTSRLYAYGYKTMTWWFASTTILDVKTEAAKAYLMNMFQEFILWFRQEHIRLWHIERYGEVWLDMMMQRLQERMYILQCDMARSSV
jgi:hypothetical protein